jgi:VCBS repeat-containing protein
VVSAFAHGVTLGTPGNSLAGDFGTLTLNADGSYSYVVDNANPTVQALRTFAQTLPDTFNYTIRDSAGLTTSSTLTVTIHGANDNPVAVADTPSATEAGTSAGVDPSGNVLTNDTDVDSTANGETKTVQGVAAGTQAGPLSTNVASNVTGSFGKLNIAADGSYVYTVDNANTTVQALRTSAQTLTDTFSYTMHDAANATSTAQVTVTIHGQNDAPVANADTAIATEAGGTNNGTAGTNISNFNVLTGVGAGSVADTDVDSAANGETQTVQGIEIGSHPSDVVTTGVGSALAGSFGTLTLNSNGSTTATIPSTRSTPAATSMTSSPTPCMTRQVRPPRPR